MSEEIPAGDPQVVITLQDIAHAFRVVSEAEKFVDAYIEHKPIADAFRELIHSLDTLDSDEAAAIANDLERYVRWTRVEMPYPAVLHLWGSDDPPPQR